jgi:riboflavin synthase
MFARYDMAKDVIAVLEEYTGRIQYKRYTVPGIKDLPVASKILLNQRGCDLVIALGMPGPKAYDKVSAKTASEGLMQVQLTTEKHILEVFIHEDEGLEDDTYLKEIMQDRARSHAQNAVYLLLDPQKLTDMAGQGIRQGYPDARPVY